MAPQHRGPGTRGKVWVWDEARLGVWLPSSLYNLGKPLPSLGLTVHVRGWRGSGGASGHCTCPKGPGRTQMPGYTGVYRQLWDSGRAKGKKPPLNYRAVVPGVSVQLGWGALGRMIDMRGKM